MALLKSCDLREPYMVWRDIHVRTQSLARLIEKKTKTVNKQRASGWLGVLVSGYLAGYVSDLPAN